MSKNLSDIPPEQLKSRYGVLLDEAKLADKIAAINGVSRSRVFEWYRRGFPISAVVILEFMEKTDPKNWPMRVKTATKRD